jgi:hypothetical protein
MKLVSPSKEHLEKHYEDLADKPFFKGLVTCEIHLVFLVKTGADESTQTCSVVPFVLWCGKAVMPARLVGVCLR